MPDDSDAVRDNLDFILVAAWSRLETGARDRRAAFHTVQIASLDAAGAPRVRTVVLRNAEPEAARLRIHTDRRSGKISGLDRDPRCELHGYDPEAKIQIRATGRATLHRVDPTADAAWAATRPGSRVCYRATAPGARLAAPDEADPDETIVKPENPDLGRENFVALVLTVERLEWLHLAARGHRRAEFLRDGESWRGRWLAP